MKKGRKVRRKPEYQDSVWNRTCKEKSFKPDEVFEIERDSKVNYVKEEIMLFGEWWHLDRFDAVAETIEEQLVRASKLIGTEVNYSTDGGDLRTRKVVDIELVSRTNFVERNYSPMVINELDKNDYVIALRLCLGNIPLSAVIEKPTMINVKLNSSYTAEVYKDTVVVGCQTIPFSVIEEIVEANKKL